MRAQRAGHGARNRRLVAISVLILVVQAVAAFTAPRAAAADAGWIQTDEVSAAAGYGKEFGKSVAIDGDTMVVGAQEGDHVRADGQCGQGAAYVFTRSASPIWELVARLLPSQRSCSDQFGASISISGDWIAVGDPHENILPPGEVHGSDEEVSWQGAVYLYRKPAGGWQDATETDWISEFDGAEATGISPDWDDAFGASVKLHGTTLFVGAPGWDENGPQTGAVFVYSNPIDAGWQPAAKLTTSVVEARSRFGGGLAYSDGTLLVGNTESDYGWAYGAYTPSDAYIFEEPVDGWATSDQETARLDLGAWVFAAVALDGDTAVISDPYYQASVVFTEPVGGWVDTSVVNARLVPGSIQSGRFPGLYGAAVAIEGDLVVVTAPFTFIDPDDDKDGGEAWVYRRPADGWGATGDPITVDAATKLRDGGVSGVLGWSVTIKAGAVAIGDIGEDHFNPESGTPNLMAGSVYVFAESTDSERPTTAIAREPLVPGGGQGWDTGPVTLRVSADDGANGSGIAEVRCQLDTVLPAPTFDDLPAGPCRFADADGDAVTMDGFHTLYAASVDAVGNRSAMTTLPVQIDTRPPRTYITLSPAEPDQDDGTYSTPVDVRLDYGDDPEGSGKESVRCMLDPATAPATWADMPTTLCGTDFFLGAGRRFDSGGHTIWIAAQDRAGNVSLPMSASFTIDRAPTVVVGLNPAAPDGSNGWWRNPVRVTVTGTPAPGGPAPSVRCVLDPAIAPATFDQLPASCPYFLGGALVSSDGQHTVYAAARDTTGSTSPVQSASFRIDNTPPSLTCDGSGPAAFTIGQSQGTLTATVTDGGSGPGAPTADTQLTSTSLANVGNRTAIIMATDLAGNEGTASCAYAVGYDVEVASPQPGAVFAAGTTVNVTFMLLNANGTPISDASAAVLAGGRKSPCYVDALFDGVAQRVCPTYSASTDTFTIKVKTPKGKNVAGLHDIAIQIRDPAGTGVVNVVRLIIQLTK